MTKIDISAIRDEYKMQSLSKSDVGEHPVEFFKKWFEEAREGFLCAVNMISEGAHYRGVNTIFMFRRTKSELLFQQQIGRIISLSKFDNPNAILFDLVNNANSIEVSKPLKISIGKRKQFLEQEKNFAESEQIIIKDYTTEIVEILNQIASQNEQYAKWESWEDEIILKYYPTEGKDKTPWKIKANV